MHDDPTPEDAPLRSSAPWLVRYGPWIAIAVVALTLRVVYLNQLAAFPFFDAPVGESAVHLKLARDVLAGHWIPSRPFFYASMLYPYFLAGVLSLHGSVYVVCLIQVLAGVLLVILIGALAHRLYGAAAGLAAAVLAALYGPFAFLEADVLGIVWALVSLVLATLLVLRWADHAEDSRHSPVVLVLAGLAFGAAAAERPNLGVVVPLVAGWCAFQARRFRLLPALALLGGAILPIALIGALNFGAAGQWIPLATSRGLNLAIGFHPGAGGTYDEPWADRNDQFSAQYTELEEASVAMASRVAGRRLSPEQASDYWSGQALGYIRSHPSEAARLILRKAILLLNVAEIPNHLDFDFIRERAPALAAMPVGFGAVLPLATIGIGFLVADPSRRRRKGTLLILAMAAACAASVLPFFVAERYRIPMLPPLLALAGCGTAALLGVASRRITVTPARFAAILLAGASMAWVAHLSLAAPMRSRDHWIFAEAYERRGDLRAAAREYEAAVSERGNDGELLTNLAIVYRKLGEPARAEALLRRAIAANPRLSYPHMNLGMLLIGRGDYSGAYAELVVAVRLQPNDVDALGALGALLAEGGAKREAKAMFERARALAPEDPRLARLIASYPSVADPDFARR
jgi:Flp pilus assembly protein TadD